MPEKTPLVLLPGLLCDEALWGHQTETLVDVADITVADMTRDDSTAGMAARILAAAPERFALAGLSMGGYVAFEVMRRAPERVSHLALMDTSAAPDTAARGRLRRQHMALVESGDFDGMLRQQLPFWVLPDRRHDADLMMVVEASARNVGPDAYLRQQRAIIGRPDSRPGLAAVAAPTLVLCGREDAGTPLEGHEEIATAIPHATLVVIEDCGHLSTLERPEAVSAALREWLTS